MPELDRIAERMVRGFSQVLARTGSTAKVTSASAKTENFAEWKATLPSVLAVGRYRDQSIKGGLLVKVPASLLSVLVDAVYGGSGEAGPSRASLGLAEQRLFARLATQIEDVLAKAWADTGKITPAIVATAFTAEDIRFCKPNDLIVVQSFAIATDGAETTAIEVIYPLAGIRNLTGAEERSGSDLEEVDPAWRMRLSDAVMNTRLPVRTVIARPSVPLNKLVTLTIGDFIPLTLPKRVPVTVAGRLLAHGTIGQANGRAAIKIDKLEQGAFFHD